jgi:glycosyltransferase involved in cell wall biosynthesis
MRILMVTQCYPPVFGGIEQHVRNLSAELAARGHEVAVATLWQQDTPEYEVQGQVRIYRLRGSVHRLADVLYTNAQRFYAPPAPDPELGQALRRVLARERPQVVHAHNWLVSSYIPLKSWARAPLLMALHDYSFVCPRWTLMREGQVCPGPRWARCMQCAARQYGPIKGPLTALGVRHFVDARRADVDLFLPVSTAVAEGNGLISRRLPYRIIPPFASAPPQSEPASIVPYLAQLPRPGFLLFVGGLSRHKGYDVLLHAYGRLTGVPPLVLIGYETSEIPIAAINPPPNVTILRHWPHEAVMAAWRRSLLGVVPSVWPDPCPTVTLEAMAAGRPVIASRMGGLPDEVVDGVTGILTPPGDGEALQRAILRLVNDPDLCTRMGQAGLSRFAEFAPASVVPRFEQAYTDTLAGYRAGK